MQFNPEARVRLSCECPIESNNAGEEEEAKKKGDRIRINPATKKADGADTQLVCVCM